MSMEAVCPWAFVGVEDFRYREMSSECPWMSFDMVEYRCRTRGHSDVNFDGLVLSGERNRAAIRGTEHPWTRMDIKDCQYQNLCLCDVIAQQLNKRARAIPSMKNDFCHLL